MHSYCDIVNVRFGAFVVFRSVHTLLKVGDEEFGDFAGGGALVVHTIMNGGGGPDLEIPN